MSAADLTQRSATMGEVPADALVANSVSGALWTAVSRLTGFAQTLTVGAILGATYLGNTYQSVNSLPNIVYYQLLSGSLFAAILVPPLVHRIDAGGFRQRERLHPHHPFHHVRQVFHQLGGIAATERTEMPDLPAERFQMRTNVGHDIIRAADKKDRFAGAHITRR